MDWTGTILVSVVTMLAVVFAIARDVRTYRRVGAAGSRPSPRLTQEAIAKAVAREASATLAGALGDPDPIHELAERLCAIRLLGREYVRTTHPLFRADESETGLPTGSVATALLMREPELIEPAPMTPPIPPRRPHHGRLRSAAALRLVVSRDV